MTISGSLHKMQVEHDSTVQYKLQLNDDLIDMNALVGHSIELNSLGRIECVACGKKTSKSFQQGHCFGCFRKLARCDRCIMSPELCHFSQGTCREPEWGQEHCMVPHIVYLANSSGLKVGITRGTQVPIRWMDQGAIQAMPLIGVNTRLDSGLIEVILKQHVSDRTNWRNMLKNVVKPIDLAHKSKELLNEIQQDLNSLSDQGVVFDVLEPQPYEFNYPVLQYPEKIKSQSFDKQQIVAGKLQGIKGQYLLLDTGVINIRKFTGYQIELSSEVL